MSKLQRRIGKLEKASSSKERGSIIVDLVGSDFVTVDGVKIPRDEYEPEPGTIVVDLTKGLTPRG